MTPLEKRALEELRILVAGSGAELMNVRHLTQEQLLPHSCHLVRQNEKAVQLIDTILAS